jgi:alkylation response protein AidB-like acyl-CoA dehydrogenase
MIDFSLTEEQLLLQKTARDFANKEIKSLAIELDKNPEPVAAQIPFELYKKAGKLGFSKMTLPEEYGGPELGNLDVIIVMEELATADSGFAAVLQTPNGFIKELMVLGTERQRKRWLTEMASEDYVGVAWGSGEPDRGGSEMVCTIPDPELGIKTYAKREGEYYVINGTKHAFVTGAGPDTKYYFVTARTDLTKPQFDTITKFIVPADTPGFTVGKQTDKIGWRGAPHAEIYLENVRLTREYIVGEKEGLGRSPFGLDMPIGAAAFCVGVARAAFEYAVDYANQRVTWGKPIVNHQAVAMSLAEMKMEIQAARLLVWQAAWNNDAHFGEPGYINTLIPICKAFASDIALKVTQNAMLILGGYGICKEFPLERYHREAQACSLSCFHRNIHMLITARGLGYVPS